MLTNYLGRRRFFATTGAVAALEFALIAPVAGIMMLATFNISRAIVIWEEVQNTAHLVSVSATTVSSVSSKDTNARQTSLTDAAIQQSLSIIYAQMPWVANGAETGRRSVTLTSIGFLPADKSANCQPTASQNCNLPYVAFSVAYNGGSLPGKIYFDKPLRPCGSMYSLSSQVTPGAHLQATQTWLNTLPTAAVSQPDAVMVADVHYNFVPYLPPLIKNIFPQSFDFYATNMWPARIGPFNLPPGQQYTIMDPQSSSGTGPCAAPPANNS